MYNSLHKEHLNDIFLIFRCIHSAPENAIGPKQQLFQAVQREFLLGHCRRSRKGWFIGQESVRRQDDKVKRGPEKDLFGVEEETLNWTYRGQGVGLERKAPKHKTTSGILFQADKGLISSRKASLTTASCLKSNSEPCR